ncbi:MAG TPA: flagellar basal body rod protein FlgB [Spirochaetia bacterium]|nr:flagellar basal body rod protein FlgB [Spirochaetia bacterium]
MIFAGTFGKNLEIMTRELDVAALRQNVIANNVANADTPNFKRSVVSFESQLRRALDSEKAPRFPQAITDPRDIPFDRSLDWQQVKPRRTLDYLTESKNNGNNVDIEEEGTNALTNQLLYTTLVQAVTSQIQGVNIVLR